MKSKEKSLTFKLSSKMLFYCFILKLFALSISLIALYIVCRWPNKSNFEFVSLHDHSKYQNGTAIYSVCNLLSLQFTQSAIYSVYNLIMQLSL